MSGLTVPSRVHVAPVGYERDRIVVPARQLNADHVVLLAYEDETDHPELVDAVRDRLEDNNIDHETVDCDLFDFYDCIGTIGSVASTFPDDEVFVNLASGSKVTAIGGMIACMATGATPYYVRAERYTSSTEPPVTEGVERIAALPTYPMDSPDPQHVAVLEYLSERESATKKQLIRFAEDRGLAFISGYEDSDLTGKYRRLDAHIVDPLADTGDVTVDARGRSRRVSITDDGRNTLRAFAYRLE